MRTGTGSRWTLSGETARVKTGKSWDEWSALLDAWTGGETRSLVDLVHYLTTEHGLSRHWAQVVAVYYRWGQRMGI